jgi:hypothetical protein
VPADCQSPARLIPEAHLESEKSHSGQRTDFLVACCGQRSQTHTEREKA